MSNRELEIRIVNIFQSIPGDAMYGEVLRVILEAMECEHGVFCYLNGKGDLICPSLTGDIWNQCQVPDKTIVSPMNRWLNICGLAIEEKKSFYSPTPSIVPQGHILISRNLAVPIVHQSKAIGLLHVANKTSDYLEEDRELLETISDLIAPKLDAKLKKNKQDKLFINGHSPLSFDEKRLIPPGKRDLHTVHFPGKKLKEFEKYQELNGADNDAVFVGDVENYAGFFEKDVQKDSGNEPDTQTDHKKGRIMPMEISANSSNFAGDNILQSSFRGISQLEQVEKILRKREQELKIKTAELKEANIALKVMLQKNEENKTDLEVKMTCNIRELILPSLDKLKKAGLNNKLLACLNIMETNLKNIISSFSHKLSSQYLNLTPTEIQIANLIKAGIKTKEITELLCISKSTVEGHRRSIRKKLGISNQKTNLQTLLISLETDK